MGQDTEKGDDRRIGYILSAARRFNRNFDFIGFVYRVASNDHSRGLLSDLLSGQDWEQKTYFCVPLYVVCARQIDLNLIS